MNQPDKKMPTAAPFVVIGYVRVTGEGPLSITEVDDTSITIVTLLYGADEVLLKLSRGVPLQTIVGELKNLQRTVVKFPTSALREVSWFEARSDVVFRYELDGKRKKATTYIHSATGRVGLMEVLQSRFPQPFRTEQIRAGIFQVAWSNILGAIVSLAGTVWMYLNWDPVQIARVRNGRLALAIGREGCAMIGVGIFVACCVCGWYAVRKHHSRFRCFVK